MNDHIQRPAQIATLLLAASALPARQRARDQQPDRAGNRLRQDVLQRIIEIDPEPSEMYIVLERIIGESAESAGPWRAIALGVAKEIEAATKNPLVAQWLLDETTRLTSRDSRP